MYLYFFNMNCSTVPRSLCSRIESHAPPMSSNFASLIGTNFITTIPYEALWILIFKIFDDPVAILIMICPKIRFVVRFSVALKC